jgi:carbon storage regulator
VPSAPSSDPIAAQAPAVSHGRLVVSRTRQQSVMIGDDVEITVLSVSDSTVKIGIRAPRDVRILRTEVFQALLT